MTRHTFARWCLATSAALGVAPAALGVDHTVTFEETISGWSIAGRTNVYPTGGNPDACLGDLIIEVFGADVRTDEITPDTTPFLGDLSRHGPFALSLDVKMDSITMLGTTVPRSFIVEFLDFNPPGSDYPWVSVWKELGDFTGDPEPWRTFNVEIDPSSASLPPGWNGTGAETPLGDPILPAGRTFASVLASVDQIRFTTMVPGFFYGFTDFDMRVDNIRISNGSGGCVADFDDGSGTGTRDGGVGIEDLLYYLSVFEAGTIAADIDNGSGTGTPDGGVGIEDLLYFLVRFEAGC